MARIKMKNGRGETNLSNWFRIDIKLIPTLGDPHTILMPVEAVWGTKYPEPGMIRLSVGFEEYDELLKTVKNGLEKL